MPYLPRQGDLIYLDFNPQTGHEQRGRRPALVVSNDTYNQFTKAAMVCPITNTNRGIPLHVLLDERTMTTGVIMCEQVKALDVQKRGAEFIESLPADIFERVKELLLSFVE